jgi:hypothetical protein
VALVFASKAEDNGNLKLLVVFGLLGISKLADKGVVDW